MSDTEYDTEYFENIGNAIQDMAIQRNWGDELDEMTAKVDHYIRSHFQFDFMTVSQVGHWFYYSVWIQMCKSSSLSFSSNPVTNSY
jgi:hypothetical protein